MLIHDALESGSLSLRLSLPSQWRTICWALPSTELSGIYWPTARTCVRVCAYAYQRARTRLCAYLRAHAACMRVPVCLCVARFIASIGSVFACVRVCPYPRVFRRVHACASVHCKRLRMCVCMCMCCAPASASACACACACGGLHGNCQGRQPIPSRTIKAFRKKPTPYPKRPTLICLSGHVCQNQIRSHFLGRPALAPVRTLVASWSGRKSCK